MKLSFNPFFERSRDLKKYLFERFDETKKVINLRIKYDGMLFSLGVFADSLFSLGVFADSFGGKGHLIFTRNSTRFIFNSIKFILFLFLFSVNFAHLVVKVFQFI